MCNRGELLVLPFSYHWVVGETYLFPLGVLFTLFGEFEIFYKILLVLVG